MHSVWQWLFSVDAPTRAAVIGATATVVSVAIALLGVLLTIRSNQVRAREDQLITLRREAYLEACEVTAEAVQFLTTLVEPNVTLASGLPVMRKVGGAMGKLHVLADQRTLDVVMTYLNAFLGEYIEAAKLKSLFEMNATVFASIQQRIALANTTDERNKLQLEMLQLSRANVSLTKQLIDHCINIVERLNGPATAVTLALRKELKLSLDEDWYRRMQARNIELNTTRSKPVLEGLRENVVKIETLLTDLARLQGPR